MTRKYGQKGYLEGEKTGRPARPGGPRERPEGPRGRGLGAPTETVFRCARCGQAHPLGEEIAPRAVCSKCGEDLHTCTNCAHFDTSAPHECRQPIDAPVARKAKANECSLFAPKAAREVKGDSPARNDPRSAFDALFKL